MEKKKSDKSGRILGRRLARELDSAELENASGSLEQAPSTSAYSTWTTSYPPDGPYRDGGSTGPVWV
jgi:hypothetical protein